MTGTGLKSFTRKIWVSWITTTIHFPIAAIFQYAELGIEDLCTLRVSWRVIEWLIYIGFEPLQVPMHLGLIDGPFVPHNLISAQESPVALPNFQMAPRLKMLLSTASKKGTQIYSPFLSKVPANESPPGSPMGPLWREMPISRAFLNMYSRVPSKGAFPRGPPHWASSERNSPFLEPLYLSLKVLCRWAPFQVPQRGPYGMRCPSPEPFLAILQGTQQGGPPTRFPSQSPHR